MYEQSVLLSTRAKADYPGVFLKDFRSNQGVHNIRPQFWIFLPLMRMCGDATS